MPHTLFSCTVQPSKLKQTIIIISIYSSIQHAKVRNARLWSKIENLNVQKKLSTREKNLFINKINYFSFAKGTLGLSYHKCHRHLTGFFIRVSVNNVGRLLKYASFNFWSCKLYFPLFFIPLKFEIIVFSF